MNQVGTDALACTRVQRAVDQAVQLHGTSCQLTGSAGNYAVKGPDGALLATAPQRLLAVSRASAALRGAL